MQLIELFSPMDEAAELVLENQEQPAMVIARNVGCFLEDARTYMYAQGYWVHRPGCPLPEFTKFNLFQLDRLRRKLHLNEAGRPNLRQPELGFFPLRRETGAFIRGWNQYIEKNNLDPKDIPHSWTFHFSSAFVLLCFTV
ncbi:hypothetical protein AJ79_02776 [Helicocarpus griseus UAMH5409]|uniref:Uncharacterized protein n=1 Tax=Helicocarpus griseus UAMH5409 TaxID=1447875 RepID=A0A2B7Y1K5_9EURO|nr:hypothetical protein AJ79_02776 [Helicocarpus griseus UAMH5409]